MPNGSPSVDALELLTSQHTDVDQLISRLEAGTGDRVALFRELADKLAAHATVEEKIFYPSVMQDQTAELLHESVEEHLAVKRVLADMLELDPAGDKDEFDAKLSVLKEQVSHHAHEEEEQKLFPKLRKAMTADELGGIGNDVLALFEQLMAQEPRRSVPGELDHAAPLPM
jgi:hypothetical protein